jgi:hypothetical protein
MRARIGILALSVALTASHAVAQSTDISPLEPPSTARYLSWGPFRVRPGLVIPTLGYDNNVFAIPTDSPVKPIGAYFIDLSPRIEGLVLFGSRAFLTFAERLDLFFYSKETELNYFNTFGKMRLTVPFGQFGIYGDIGYDRTRDRPYDAQDIRPIRKTYPYGLGLIVKFGWRTDMELGYRHTRNTAEDPNDPCAVPGATCPTVSDLNNRVDDGVRLSARYLAFGRTRLLLALSRQTINFDDPNTAVERDGNEQRQLVGLDFGLGGRVFGTFRVGHANFDLTDPGGTDFNGPVADIALGYNLGSMGSRITLTGARDVRYTVYNSTPLYVYTGADLGLVKYFNRFIGMEISGGRATLDFIGTPRVDDDLTGTLGVRFRIAENDLGRRVEYAFRYTRYVIDSTIPFNDQNRGTVGFGVSIGY